jgi:pyruvate formate lyase activating enzyme
VTAGGRASEDSGSEAGGRAVGDPAGGPTALIFDIQRFSVHDGPGIRTLVFFKGCPLRCRWCSNPESQVCAQELGYLPGRCLGCLACVEACARGAVSLGADGRPQTDRDRCVGCGDCTATCFADARVLSGRRMTVSEVMEQIRRDEVFYRRSGGGVTLGGGEVLAWASFAARLLAACKAEGIDTAVETGGCGAWADLQQLVPHVDSWYYDVKHADPGVHARLTGSGNVEIIENLRRLAATGAAVVVRVPVVPGLTDREADVRAVARLVAAGRLAGRIELLPYHRLGEEKYGRLGRAYELAGLEPPGEECLRELAAAVEAEGVPCRIGG